MTCMDDQKRRRFLWGICLAWLPWIPTIIGLAQVFRGISEEKATGIAVLAGGLTEMFVTIGLIATVVFATGAIVLLVPALDRSQRIRSLFSVVSICLSALMLVFVALYVWIMWSMRRGT